MRNTVLILISCFFLIYSCSINDNNLPEESNQQREVYQWHLINVSGGLAGVDIDYDLETIIWVFNVGFSGNGGLIVENDNTDSSLEDGINTGSYNISMQVIENGTYLFIEGEEFGKVSTPTSVDLIIDQNSLSTGTGADGYIYTFKRKVILVDTN